MATPMPKKKTGGLLSSATATPSITATSTSPTMTATSQSSQQSQPSFNYRTDYNANGTLWKEGGDGKRQWIGGTPTFGSDQIAQYLNKDPAEVKRQLGFDHLPAQWRDYNWGEILNSDNPLGTIQGLKQTAYDSNPETAQQYRSHIGFDENHIQSGRVAARIDPKTRQLTGFTALDNNGVPLDTTGWYADSMLETLNRYGIDRSELSGLAEALESAGVNYQPYDLYSGTGSDQGVNLRDLASGGMGSAYDWTAGTNNAMKGDSAAERTARNQALYDDMGVTKNPAVTTEQGIDPTRFEPQGDRRYVVYNGGTASWYATPEQAQAAANQNGGSVYDAAGGDVIYTPGGSGSPAGQGGSGTQAGGTGGSGAPAGGNAAPTYTTPDYEQYTAPGYQDYAVNTSAPSSQAGDYFMQNNGALSTAWQDNASPWQAYQDRSYVTSSAQGMPDGTQNAQSSAALVDSLQGAATRQVGENETVQGLLGRILAEDSPLMQRAANQGTQQAARRGLLNSSMAAGAAQGAMIDRALPIASQDAQTYSRQALANQDATNRFALTNNQFRQNMYAQDDSQSFTAAQSALDRAQQRDLTNAQYNFQGDQANLDRRQQRDMTLLGADIQADRDNRLAGLDADMARLNADLQEAQAQNDFARTQALTQQQADLQRERDTLLFGQDLERMTADYGFRGDLAQQEFQNAMREMFAASKGNAWAVMNNNVTDLVAQASAQIDAIQQNPNISAEDKESMINDVISRRDTDIEFQQGLYSSLSDTLLNTGVFPTGITNQQDGQRQRAIAHAYREVLGREPDDAGMAYWMQQDLTPEQIRQTIANSAEATGGQ
ncbi:DUF4214 domain-containing protein [Billgrantia azerbaijanica]|nr:DUF4214 domain-containing protein [Halomonas azerbaijanica]